jgi:hypothetical protein
MKPRLRIGADPESGFFYTYHSDYAYIHARLDLFVCDFVILIISLTVPIFGPGMFGCLYAVRQKYGRVLVLRSDGIVACLSHF